MDMHWSPKVLEEVVEMEELWICALDRLAVWDIRDILRIMAIWTYGRRGI